MKTRLALAVLAAATLCYGQQQMRMEVGMRPGSSRQAEPARTATPEQLERGRQMLKLAETQAAGLEGGMRSYALLQVARAFQQTDKKKALALLEDALAATRAIDDELNTRFAETAYKKDSNADDPNKALKAYWPSAEAYRGMLRLAVRISPVWAANLAKEISDPEMKVVAQIAMASSLLDIPAGASLIMNANKQGTNMSMSMERRD